MHIAFMPYGARSEVKNLFRDMEAQKFEMKLTKQGEKDRAVWISAQIRLLPFGVVEYVFPREYRDMVIHTLKDNTMPNRYGRPPMIIYAMRKALKLKPLPKNYSREKKLLWIMDNVSIIPIGIREDSNLVETIDKGFKGWTHESI